MVNIVKRKNSTSLDEKGLKYSLVRGIDESLKDFHTRILKANSNAEHSKYKTERSFEYATPLAGFDIFKLTKNTETEVVDISISDTRVTIFVEGQLVYKKKLEDIKFLKHFKADLDALNVFNIEIITTKEWEYLSAKNLIQNSSLRTRMKFTTPGGYNNVLPEKQIESVQDHLGYFSEDSFYDYAVVNDSQYALSDNVLFKNNPNSEDIFFEYVDFPLYIGWAPIRSYSVNGNRFNDVLNLRIKNSEAFGIIAENQEVDNNETVEVLSQKGAKIINKILAKHNTYWGE